MTDIIAFITNKCNLYDKLHLMRRIDMEQNGSNTIIHTLDRREFLRQASAATAGILLSSLLPKSLFANMGGSTDILTKVGIAEATTYDNALLKQKIQSLLESIGGISDIVKTSDKVALKINLTGGSSYANNSKLNGKSLTETVWTHPEVVRAVAELLIDYGVSANNIYIVEALWDDNSFNNFGFATVKNDLGLQMINLNNKAPYSSYVTVPVSNGYYYSSFQLNQILQEVDVYISIPKMKQHVSAGITHSLKNQIGITPLSLHTTQQVSYRREKLHTEGGQEIHHLPNSITDLCLARPVHLAIIDGIKNSRGGEGAWASTFTPYENHALVVAKDPVAADSIAAFLMGDDPEHEEVKRPDNVMCKNHLYLLNQKGIGTNHLNEIETVGDGAYLVSVQKEQRAQAPQDFALQQNYPNPFNSETLISFSLSSSSHVSIIIYDVRGKKVATLVNEVVPNGQHQVRWKANGLSSGVYICTMRANGNSVARKMVYQK
jgi:uncharacterized protein (DUF362 family)